MSDIEYIANEILLMRDGELLQQGTAQQLISSMTESVWKCYAGKKEVSYFMENFKVSNMKTASDGVELRIISKERPMADAQPVETNLEDVFLYYFGEKVSEEHVVI